MAWVRALRRSCCWSTAHRVCPTKCPTYARLEGVAAPAKLTDAAVKQIRRRMGKGEYQTDLAKEFGVNRKTIRRRVDALERAQAELDARRADNRVRRQAAREKRKLLEREREGALPPIHTNPVNRDGFSTIPSGVTRAVSSPQTTSVLWPPRRDFHLRVAQSHIAI